MATSEDEDVSFIDLFRDVTQDAYSDSKFSLEVKVRDEEMKQFVDVSPGARESVYTAVTDNGAKRVSICVVEAPPAHSRCTKGKCFRCADASSDRAAQEGQVTSVASTPNIPKRTTSLEDPFV